MIENISMEETKCHRLVALNAFKTTTLFLIEVYS